jgi:hypothetical protein
MLAPPPGNPRTYDLCFTVNGGHTFRKLDQGVILGNDGMSWTADSATGEMPFGNIVAVHLQSGGQKVIVDRCTITFSEGTVLAVVNSDPGGFSDSERVPIYRDFVRDLHARLAAGGYTGISFKAGVPRWRYQAMLAVTIAVGLFCGGFGLLTLLGFGNLKGLGILALGGYFCWQRGRITLANAPRNYGPDRLPESLLS